MRFGSFPDQLELLLFRQLVVFLTPRALSGPLTSFIWVRIHEDSVDVVSASEKWDGNRMSKRGRERGRISE